jgi:hypothetical protein
MRLKNDVIDSLATSNNKISSIVENISSSTQDKITTSGKQTITPKINLQKNDFKKLDTVPKSNHPVQNVLQKEEKFNINILKSENKSSISTYKSEHEPRSQKESARKESIVIDVINNKDIKQENSKNQKKLNYSENNPQPSSANATYRRANSNTVNFEETGITIDFTKDEPSISTPSFKNTEINTDYSSE